MLTRKQFELLVFIHERLKETGVAPSFDEMKEALNLRSKSGIHRLIKALEERGFIRRLAHRARAVEVLKLPEIAAPGLLSGKTANEPAAMRAISGGKPAAPTASAAPVAPTASSASVAPAAPSIPSAPSAIPAEVAGANDNKAISLGVMGRIAAGTPIEALQYETHRISVPIEMMRSGEHYALEVNGDSMVDAGIFDGDTAVIQQCNSAENGDIIVALIEDEEATLKRLRRKGDMIALEAANAAYETRLFKADQIQVQGRLVGLIRKY